MFLQATEEEPQGLNRKKLIYFNYLIVDDSLNKQFINMTLNKGLDNIYNILSTGKFELINTHLTSSAPVETFYELGAKFKFVSRTQEMEFLFDAAQSLINATDKFIKNHVYDQYMKTVTVPGVGGQSGVGKTRFAIEFYNSLQLTRLTNEIIHIVINSL